MNITSLRNEIICEDILSLLHRNKKMTCKEIAEGAKVDCYKARNILFRLMKTDVIKRSDIIVNKITDERFEYSMKEGR